MSMGEQAWPRSVRIYYCLVSAAAVMRLQRVRASHLMIRRTIRKDIRDRDNSAVIQVDTCLPLSTPRKSASMSRATTSCVTLASSPDCSRSVWTHFFRMGAPLLLCFLSNACAQVSNNLMQHIGFTARHRWQHAAGVKDSPTCGLGITRIHMFKPSLKMRRLQTIAHPTH